MKTKDYAARFNVDERTIRNWKKKGYNLDDPEKLEQQIGKQRHLPRNFEPATSLNSARIRKTNLECEKLHFQLEVERGKYTSNDKIRDDLIKIGSATKASLLRLENELPPILEGLTAEDMQIKIKEAVDSILGDLSKMVKKHYEA